jgi:outer membrane protein OmpA-like peptidoglycan-associated protein
MRPAVSRALAIGAFALLAACADRPPTYAVLLDNPDGHASTLTLATGGGTATVDRPGQAVGAASPDGTPGEPFAPSEQEIRQTFGKALDRAPPPPQTFTLYFVFDLPELTEESKRELPAVLEAIGPRPAPEVSVIGHADRVGSPEINYQLALRRAEQVKQSLVSVGVDERLIEVSSQGDGNPAVPSRPGVPEPRNRRVEVIVR